MSKKQSQKNPKIYGCPTESKTPKLLDNIDKNRPPQFSAEQMDMDGPYGWNRFNSFKIQELLQKIFAFQKLTWQELRNNNSHFVETKDLSAKAQKRLADIQKDDFDQLFSLNLTGRNRIWAFRIDHVLYLLWWDPDHEVCPSPKKHT